MKKYNKLKYLIIQDTFSKRTTKDGTNIQESVKKSVLWATHGG